MQIMPHDYAADRPVHGRGLALAAAEARAAAAEAANAILFDVGDACEGGPLDAEIAAEGAGPHPMSEALAAAGVAAATLGNHDFDQGFEAAARIARESPVPLTLCNLVVRDASDAGRDGFLAPPFLILDRDLACGDGARRTLRIGVTGIAPPQTLAWNADTLAGRLDARDAVDAVSGIVPRMRAAGADLVVVLAHSGIGAERAEPGMEHAAVPISAVEGVDVVLAGHAHRLFPHASFGSPSPAMDPVRGRLNGKPAVMPGLWGEAVGVVDLLLERAAEGWRIVGSAAALRPVRAARPDPAVAAVGRSHHARTLAAIRRPVGRTARPLNTYFSLLADCPAVRLVNAAQVAAVRAHRPDIAAAEGEVPLLSAAPPLKAGGLAGPDNYTDVPAGTVLQRHLVDLQIYPNRLQAVEVTGAELRMWLERAASVYATLHPGADGAPLLDSAQAAYNCDAISGVTYRIDVGTPPLSAAWGAGGSGPGRIRDLAFRGRAVRDADRFRIVTNTYRLGSHPACAELRARAEPICGLTVRAALATYIEAGGAEVPLPPVAWRLVRVPGANALYPTGPGARDRPLPERPGAGVVRRVGTDPAGFDLYRVDLDRADLLDGDAGLASGAPAVAHGAGTGDPGIA